MNPVERFASQGIYFFPAPFDVKQASALRRDILAVRDFGKELFLSQEEFEANPRHLSVNPIPGRNLLERFADQVEFLEKDPLFCECLTDLLDEGYDIFHKKIIGAVPENRIPAWLIDQLRGNMSNNLGAYVKPEFRDITYLFGSDFHMDVIDRFKWPDGSPRKHFITLYVLLEDVTEAKAPLVVMPESHRFGATVYPHDLEHKTADRWVYCDRRGRSMHLQHRLLTGGPGTCAMWHSCLLHGASVNLSDTPRISLRFIISPKSDDESCKLKDVVNRSLDGPLFLEDNEYHTDLDEKGRVMLKHSSISKIDFS